MRKQLLSVILPLLLLGLMASAAETPALPAASQRNELQRVNVVRGTDEIRVEITARGAVTPKLSTAKSPARLIVDLPGTVMATGQSRISVDSADVKGVRIAMDGQKPPTTRVVIDLEHSCRYELNPTSDGKLVLTVHTQPTEAASVPSSVAEASLSPATKGMAPFAPRVIDAKADAKPEVKADAKQEAPVKTAAATAATSDQKPGAASSSSSDFVFVEPTYTAKANAPAAANTPETMEEPTERAHDAAAKFADKTAAELLPVSVHAAQATQSTASSTGVEPAVNLAAEQKAQAGQPPAAVGPKYTGEPISVNLKDVDLKDFFRLIHEISALNIVLDPNVHGTLTIVLDDVPWDQALDIVLKNNDLSRQLDGNVLRVATVDTLKKE